MNTISSDLIATYEATQYCVTSSDSAFILRVGQHSRELAALYRDTDCASTAFITAWNPYSKMLSVEENETRQRQIISLLVAQRLRLYTGEGVSADGAWREPSLLVLGIDLVPARNLAQRFEQNGFVFCGEDAIPQLILRELD